MREAVIVDAVRTPIGKRNGMLAEHHPVDMLAHVLSGLVERNGLDPERIDDVIGGCVTQVGEQGVNVTRNAVVAAGLPHTVPATSVDRQCGSSQQAVSFAAQGVIAGGYDLAIACGVESMTRAPMASNAKGGTGPFPESFMAACDGQLKNQFEVAQHMADEWEISRTELDELALESHRRAAEHTDNGFFEREILPFAGLKQDEGIRREGSMASLAKLPSANWRPEDAPDITAGNSSQMSDGAAGMVIAERSFAEEHGLPIRAAIRHMTVAAESAIWVLTAPNRATRRLLERSGMSIDNFDAFEVNEAFAAVTLAWHREFPVDREVLNPRGGAIAIGHPLGASGVRLMMTLLNHLEDTGGRWGFQTMCEGGGQANATAIEVLG